MSSRLEIPDGDDKNYVGLSEPISKGRYADHLSSFSNKKYANKTKLSIEYWKAKDAGHNIDRKNVKFSILKKSNPYRAGSPKCNLCLWEKVCILKDGRSVINKRDEFISKCPHMNKFLLRNFKTKHK